MTKLFPDKEINALNFFFLFAFERIEDIVEKKTIENIVGNGENAGYQLFLLFPQYFQKASLSGSLIPGVVW